MRRRRGRFVPVEQPCDVLVRARATWLRPELESYIRRWVSNGRSPEYHFMDDQYWRWWLQPHHDDVRALCAMSVEELNAKIPDAPEAVDGRWHQTRWEEILEAIVG
jgi:hypothetical protein